ncbi:uncharacterized protein EI90DRAFT_3014649 [Cantharellus anzutake]|uniref:uncharacterized protein n=1 Tax=Cantharellus anzutake TaxID=1750568 RepID=UPI0019079BD3|nr:uncharacterized protein EI90DRAFT_3014649 [Cantharellus anzutake]KAF8335397.1 hypothetical protein EI90DRAFT_3014649 [Cantharellus anzutake]
MGQNYAPEMMVPMQAPPYPIFAPGMWGYNPHMQQEPVRLPIAASNDSILGNLLKQANSQHRAPVVPMSVSNVEAHNHTARPPVPTRVRVPLAGLMDGHYGHHAAPIPPPGPQGPSSSFGAMMAPPPPQPSEVPNLVPEGYSWFAEANRSPAAGTWRNVPIPGTFSRVTSALVSLSVAKTGLCRTVITAAKSGGMTGFTRS